MGDHKKHSEKSRFWVKLWRIIVTLFAIASIPFAIYVIKEKTALIEANEDKKETVSQVKPVLPLVSVVEVTKKNQQAKISAFGEVKARYELNVAAEVSGKVLKLGNDFQIGKRLRKGALLVKLDNSSYQQAYLNAKKDLADAKVNLLQEKNEQTQAKAEWKRSGLKGRPKSSLLFNEPQVFAANLGVKKSEASIVVAKQDLNHTTINSTFDSIVMSREVSVGSYVQKGGTIATLYSANSIEIRILLSDAQWHLLPSEKKLKLNKDISITLTDQQNASRHWQAQVLRIENFIETETRQRALILTVNNPIEKGLILGDFLRATIKGKTLQNTLYIPDSALSQTGDVWTIDDKSMLRKFVAKVYYSDQGKVLIQAPKGMNKINVVIRPISTYKIGMKVTSKPTKQEKLL
jgi:RND family efflux transporter MFP subunit